MNEWFSNRIRCNIGSILCHIYNWICWTYGQAEERRIHLQSTPTDKSNVNTDTVKEQWIIKFNQLLSESQEVSDDN